MTEAAATQDTATQDTATQDTASADADTDPGSPAPPGETSAQFAPAADADSSTRQDGEGPTAPAAASAAGGGEREDGWSRTKPNLLDEVLGLVGEIAAGVTHLASGESGLAELLGAAEHKVGLSGFGLGEDLEHRLVELVDLTRRRVGGDYEVDEFGFDAEFTETVLLPMLRPLYRHWWRVEVRGIENVPADSGVLIVANHSGTIPFDALMTQLALFDEHPQHRHLRMLGADFVFRSAVVGELARRSGSTLACNEDAHRLLSKGEVVGVWPEGFKGIGKPFSERYKLQRFGRGGFVTSALRTGAPIVPTAIVGAEEIYPILGNMPTLARILGTPYVPITPFFPMLGALGLVPLPSKWIIEFGEPIHTDVFGEAAADDPMAVFNIGDQVREQIQHTLYSLLMHRRSIFF